MKNTHHNSVEFSNMQPWSNTKGASVACEIRGYDRAPKPQGPERDGMIE